MGQFAGHRWSALPAREAIVAGVCPETPAARNATGQTLPSALSSAYVPCPKLLGPPTALFDDEHLAATVVPTGRADVMHHVRLATRIAIHQDGYILQVVMPAPVALAVAGDSLLWQCAHVGPFLSLQRHPAPEAS